MIRRHMIMSAAAATMALSSCGGGKDSTATPTPTTTPTPTPTASPTYTAFPLAASAEFNTFVASTTYTGDPAGAVTLGVAGIQGYTDRVKLTLDVEPSVDNSITVVRENTEESRFTKTNLTVAPATTVPEFVFRTTSTATGALAGNFSQLEVLNNTVKAKITSDAGLAFTNVGYGAWWRGDSTAGAKRLTYTLFGYNTVPTDMPTTGTGSYASRVAGRLVSTSGGTTSVLKVSGTITTTVNFATGLVSLSMALSTLPADGSAAVPYGTFTGQGAYASGSNVFTGSFSTGSPLSGPFTGAFYGSAAKEIGITFAGSGTVGAADQRLVGVVLGKK
ncbi:hypothetical protein ACG3SL_02635 [Sphingomonas sp. CJ20]